MANLRLCDRFGCAFSDDSTPAASPLGAQVDYPIGGFNNVEVMFNDDDGVAVSAKSVQDFE